MLVVPFQPRLPFPIGALPRELLEIAQQEIARILCKPQRFQGLLAEDEISLFPTSLLQIERDEPLQRTRRQPKARSVSNLPCHLVFRETNPKKLHLLLFQLFLFLYQANFIVCQLLELGLAFLFIQGVVLGDVLYFFGNLPEDLFASTESLLKHADAFEATLINVRVNSARRDQVDDGDALTLLAVAVNATNPLLHPHRVPRQVVVHNAIAELVIQALATDLRKQQNIESIAVLSRSLKHTP